MRAFFNRMQSGSFRDSGQGLPINDRFLVKDLPRGLEEWRSKKDEATNSLDLISEGVVQDALEEFGRNRTILIVAHRISTIEHADKIIVLEAGRVVESGTVTQLLAAGGLFSRFYALQLRNKHSVEELRSHAVLAS